MSAFHSLKSPRFSGIRSFMRSRILTDEWNTPDNVPDAVFLGVPFDSGTSYRPGTRFGPAAIREASTILKPYCSVLDIDISEHLELGDCGDVDTVPGYMDATLDAISQSLQPFFGAATTPIIMGGEHTISLGVLRAIKASQGPVALIHFDAHSDTLPSYYGKPYNHGTPFYWAIKEGLILPEKSIQMGIRGPLYSRGVLEWPKEQGLRIVMGEELHRRGIWDVAEEAVQRVGTTPVFVSFDIDFLDAAYAPGTGTPEVEGFTSYEALSMMRYICPRVHTVGMDLVEVLPDKDLSGITALAGASVIHAFLAALAVKKARGYSGS